jgi:hypothetical protein
VCPIIKQDVRDNHVIRDVQTTHTTLGKWGSKSHHLQNSQQPKNKEVEAQSRFGDCNGRLPYIPKPSEEERHMTAFETKTYYYKVVFSM